MISALHHDLGRVLSQVEAETLQKEAVVHYDALLLFTCVHSDKKVFIGYIDPRDAIYYVSIKGQVVLSDGTPYWGSL